MRRPILAVMFLAAFSACATTRPVPDRTKHAAVVPFVIEDGVLRFQRDCVVYVVKDAATVESARRAGDALARATMALNHQSTTGRKYPLTSVYYGMLPEIPNATVAEIEAYSPAHPTMGSSMAYAGQLSEGMARQDILASNVASARKRLEKILDEAVQSGLALIEAR